LFLKRARPAVFNSKFNVCPHAALIGCGLKELEQMARSKSHPTLPMSSDMTDEVSEKQSRSRVAVACETAKILVVDDDEHFRVLARTILEPAGFEVIESEDVPHCMVLLRCHAVDAVILDMVMPGQDGIEGLRELKQLFPQIRIVAVSGAEQSDLFLAVSAHLGADASLDKACIGALCALLQVVLDR
jgi:CheY-like chemotaxis protein